MSSNIVERPQKYTLSSQSLDQSRTDSMPSLMDPERLANGYDDTSYMTEEGTFGHNTSALRFLDADIRPTFAIKRDTSRENPSVKVQTTTTIPNPLKHEREYELSVEVVYSNPAAIGVKSLWKSLRKTIRASTAENAFRRWVEGCIKGESEGSLEYFGYLWTSFRLGDKWQIVSGTRLDLAPTEAQDAIMEVCQGRDSRQASVASIGSSTDTCQHYCKWDIRAPAINLDKFDPGVPLSEPLEPYDAFVRNFDWSKSALGPMSTWAPPMRRMFMVMMADKSPAALLLGPRLVVTYNEAFSVFLDARHEQVFATSPYDTYKEALPHLKPVYDYVLSTGYAWRNAATDSQLFFDRHGYVEECYLKRIYIPLAGPDGQVMGFYVCMTETTSKVLSCRRNKTLLDMTNKTRYASGMTDFWKRTMACLADNEPDIPFAMIYSFSTCTETDLANNKVNIKLEQTLGLDSDAISGISSINLNARKDGFASAFVEAMRTESTQLLRIEDGSLPDELASHEQLRGYKAPWTRAVLCPLRPTNNKSVFAFIVLGLNPRREYDSDYEQFIETLSSQVATAVASTVLYEKELEKGRTALDEAVMFQSHLERELEKRTKEARDKDVKFLKFAEQAPVGISIVDAAGHVKFVNNKFHKLTSIKEGEKIDKTRWLEAVYEPDVPKAEEMIRGSLVEKKPFTAELRFNTPWKGHDEVHGEITMDVTWVLILLYPELCAEGETKYVVNYMTDITFQKWVLDNTRKRMEFECEMRQQQERFIDMTSHEMRNPLSAILQCSESVISEIQNLKESTRHDPLVESIDDAAQTIAHCAEHQLRIVNDILTFSKLDSALLAVTPVEVKPVKFMERSLQTFDRQLKNSDIKLNYHVDQSFYDLNIDVLFCDPSRLYQILINLVANAIKFLQSELHREITVTMYAFAEPPTTAQLPCSFLPVQKEREDPTVSPAWGEGKETYLAFSVSDTGPGIAKDEEANLWQRFGQASPRTHVNYGGSGLGLFICRQLAELQGGQIGLRSEVGHGSNFYFYIKTKRHVQESFEFSEQQCESLRENFNQYTTKLEHIATLPRHEEPNIVKHIAASHPAFNQVAEKIQQHHGGKQQGHGHPHDGKSLAGFSILIVEDNLINQKILQKQLSKLNARVSVANHGEEALKILLDEEFWRDERGEKEREECEMCHLVLMDIEMPVMDGITCTRKIRELQDAHRLPERIPIIALTANARSEQKQMALGCGMDNIALKPYKINELVGLLQKTVDEE